MLGTITDAISLITAAQLLLFSGFLLAAKQNRSPDKISLGVFLLSNSIYIINFLGMEYKGLLLPFLKNFLFVGSAAGFLFGPLLFLYTKAVTQKHFRFNAKQLLHCIPFFIAVVIFISQYTVQPYNYKLEILRSGLFTRSESIVYLLSMNLVTFIYLFTCFIIVHRRNKDLKSYYSSTEKINFDWLKLVITAFFMMWMTDLVYWVLRSFRLNTQSLGEILTFLSLFINFVFANVLIYKNLKLPQLEDDQKPAPGKVKYESSSLTPAEKKSILSRLEGIMKTEKLFLNSSLNLGEVAQKLSVSQRYLSQVINELKKQNFYDFVNSYRVEEVKRLLSDPEYLNDKILTISYDCGFNSKSVFNTVFKKNTGFTPSEYRRKYKKTA